MLQKILATTVLVTLCASMTFAQEAPGKSIPAKSDVSQELPVLNSAPIAPSDFALLSEITVVPDMREAVMTFMTGETIHAGIEYGLSPETYEFALSTEPMTEHSETLGDLTACTTYFYRVHVGDESREGEFKTLCPKKVVQNTKYKIQNTVKTQKAVPVVSVEPVAAKPVTETAPVLNAAPDEQIQNTKDKVQNEETFPAPQDDDTAVISEGTPEAPLTPTLVATDDVQTTPSNATPGALILFALLSGMVVVFFAFKKKKKWYQR